MELPKIAFIYDRHHKANNTTKAAVYLRVTYQYTQKFKSTGILLYPSQWDASREMVKSSLEAAAYNELLMKIRIRLNQIFAQQAEKKKINISLAMDMLKSEHVEMSFLEYIQQRIRDKQVTPSTKKKYTSFYNQFAEWGKIVHFTDITEANIRKMDEWLKSRGFRQPTIYDYHKHLKQFTNDAVVDGYIESNPYTACRIRLNKGESESIDYLTEEELRRIEKLDTSGYLQHTKDLFLLQCYTGLAYADLINFDIDEYVLRDGKWQTRDTARTKTGTRYYLQLMEPAVTILEKYNYKVPPISNQKYNIFLKSLGAAAKIKKPLHSHMGRATFAVLMLSKGARIQNVQKMLGHTNLSQTKRYATVLAKDIMNDFDMVEEKIKKE
jgi:site-specific recombinase XerD